MKKLIWGFIVAICLFPVLIKAETLSWNASPETDLAGYKVYQSTVSGQYGAPLATLGKVTSFVVTLPPSLMDQRFFFTLTAYDFAGNESAKAAEVSKLILAVPAPVKPGIPVLQVSVRTTTSLTVTYAPVPDGLGGSGQASVDVRFAPMPISWGSATSSGCPSSPCTITGLNSDTSYDLQSVAYRGTLGTNAVFGPLSEIVIAKTLALDLPPSLPLGLQISKNTPDQIIIVANTGDCVRVLTTTKGSTVRLQQRTITCIR